MKGHVLWTPFKVGQKSTSSPVSISGLNMDVNTVYTLNISGKYNLLTSFSFRRQTKNDV